MTHEELIQAASEAIEEFGEDALEAYAEKEKLIASLVADFKSEFPEHTKAEIKLLRARLDGFTNEELRVLYGQILKLPKGNCDEHPKT
ncbi:hypothetical protein phi1422_0028 [Bdellovibrio phage phi1422]|uniref:hypothetical protein n=1 Tax=Bdellovibrio phage phi1422 TaxID=1127515 RepID=UPI0002536D50|nr:hypothetical protein F395_gp28 [Bdellovibrio phage phi1422]AFC22548.1 hypothetical protein phi1422_0028 [Bdellovibrio phage phi1422]